MTVTAKNTNNIASGLSLTNVPISEHNKSTAIDVLAQTALPTTRVEAWKYTRVAKLEKIDFRNEEASIDSVTDYLIDETKCSFVFVNGHFAADL